jgi:ABC-type Fe3+-hydroxamate transport system substrate-binding protein
MLRKESAFGLDRMDAYAHFQNRANAIKNRFNKFLIDTRISGKTVAAYGAAAKGNTLINFCGIRKDLIHFVVDASPHKQGRYTPGTHIPVVSEESIREVKPDYVVIFPWNIRDEISEQLEYIRRWGGKFVVAIPGFEVF